MLKLTVCGPHILFLPILQKVSHVSVEGWVNSPPTQTFRSTRKDMCSMSHLCCRFEMPLMIPVSVVAGLRWARGQDGRWWYTSRLPWMWFLSRTLVWPCSRTSDRQLNTAWPLDKQVSNPVSNLEDHPPGAIESHMSCLFLTHFVHRGYMGAKLTNNIECEIFQVLFE